MLLHLARILPMLMVGRNPQGKAGNSGGSQGQQGAASGAGSGGQAGGNQQGSGNRMPGNRPGSAQPGVVQPSEFYVLDPNNPNSRYTGLQIREAVTRANQYDNLQSEFHRTQNSLQRERQARVAAEQQLKAIKERENIANVVQQMTGGEAQPGQTRGQFQQQNRQQQGQQTGAPNAGGDADDDWLDSFMSDSSFQSGGQAQMRQAQNASGANDAQSASSASSWNDPRQVATMMQALIKQELAKTLTPIQQQLPQMVNQAVSQGFNQQARQENVRQSFHAGREQLADDLLNKWGVDKDRSKDILDKWALSSANYEEASRLMNNQYRTPQEQQQAQQLAEQKIAQGNMFFNAALQDGIAAAQEGQQARMQQEAQQALLTGDYVDLGDRENVNPNVWDPNQIAAENQQNLQKAMEIAETAGRLQSVAGPTGGPIQPSGFIQPGYIQPGLNQPTGNAPPEPTEPMFGDLSRQAAPAPGTVTRPQQAGRGQAQFNAQNVPEWGSYQVA